MPKTVLTAVIQSVQHFPFHKISSDILNMLYLPKEAEYSHVRLTYFIIFKFTQLSLHWRTLAILLSNQQRKCERCLKPTNDTADLTGAYYVSLFTPNQSSVCVSAAASLSSQDHDHGKLLSTVHMLGVNRTNDLNTGLGKVIKLWYHRSDMQCWRRKSKITKGKYVRMNLHLSGDMISHGTRALKLIQRSLYEGQYYKWTACQTESLNLHNRTVTCSLYHTPLVFCWKVWTLLHFQNQNSRVNLCERLRLDRHSSTTWLQACKAWAKSFHICIRDFYYPFISQAWRVWTKSDRCNPVSPSLRCTPLKLGSDSVIQNGQASD